jgi:hypothetical protein
VLSYSALPLGSKWVRPVCGTRLQRNGAVIAVSRPKRPTPARCDFVRMHGIAGRGPPHTEAKMSIYDFSARLSTGEERHLADFRGKVLLVVKCRLEMRVHAAVRGPAESLRTVRAARL